MGTLPRICCLFACLLAVAASRPADAQVVTRESDGHGGTVESMDLGFFALTDTTRTRVIGGTMVRVTRADGARDILLVLWYSGKRVAAIREDAPMDVEAGVESMRVPIFGPVTRTEEADGAATETTAYRFSPEQARWLARAGEVRLRIAAGGGSLDCTLVDANLRPLRVFVAGVIGPS
ncbi:MAG: hypothetical protein L0271_01320 [Gemmatimonadetes bacterium]|nr:hypothetical protein [Gemmatimonadota bacterium]